MIMIWKEPSIELIGASFLDDNAPPTMEPIESHLDAFGEVGGRICYMSYGKGRSGNKEYLANILEKGHESVLEHGNVTFHIEGISRACSHEMVRHRHLSFSQLSQRYVTKLSFVMHPRFGKDESLQKQFVDYCGEISKFYAKMMEKLEGSKIPEKEAARAILPNCTETKMIVTGNLRAWRHFCKVRGSQYADAEIRRVACMVLELLKVAAPNSFQDMEVVDGTVGVISPRMVDEHKMDFPLQNKSMGSDEE